MWRGGLGRCLCSLLARSFGCGCHIISTMLRFHTPLIKPGGRISRTRLSDKACVIAIFPLRRQRRLVHGGAGRVSGVSQPVSGVHRLAPISRLSSPSALGLELRPLPSTRVTRRPRYYEPLRHPGGNPACGVGPGGVSEKSLPMRSVREAAPSWAGRRGARVSESAFQVTCPSGSWHAETRILAKEPRPATTAVGTSRQGRVVIRRRVDSSIGRFRQLAQRLRET